MKKPPFYTPAVVPDLGAGAAIELAVQQDRPQPQPKTQVTDAGYVCPLTGETLPCPNCCPAKKD